MTEPAVDNPLLALQTHLPPPFDEISPEHVEPAIRQLLDDLQRAMAKIEAEVQPTWASRIEDLTRMFEPLQLAWGAVGHLTGVRNSPALRAAHEAVQPAVVELLTRVGQSTPLHAAAVALRDGPDGASLDEAQRRILDASIRGAELSGVALEGAPKARFNEIQMELAELSTTFSNNVLDATKAYELILRSPAEVDGLPTTARELAAQSYREARSDDVEAAQDADEAATAEHGPWRITLDGPSLSPFLQHATRRDLRERVYRAYVSRASEGDTDNRGVIDRILELRAEQAELLGFTDFASLSLARKMADSVAEIRGLLGELRERAWPAAQRDHEELQAFAAEQGFEGELRHWDVGFWAERLREHRYAITDEQLRPYFPLPRVLDGLFALAERLFDVKVVAADGDAPVWHEDVRFFRILDAGSGAPRAAFYLDPYSRPAEKRGGAWMADCLGRSRTLAGPGEAVRLPIAYLVCNGTPPVGERPSLMTFREVETLFHEFGHGLQHMLTTVDRDGAAGIDNVEWDAVELPSQFMENWCYHQPTLRGFSGHWETGDPLPQALFDKLLAARTYRAGSDTLRQLYFGLTDLALHDGYQPTAERSPFDVQREVAATCTVLTPLPEDRFLCAFSHIFAGGYAAGYYSYKWAEVLSADAFGAFEDAGLDDEAAVRATGRRFRDTVLALGGSRHPMKVFEDFRGRGPATEALLRHAGLTG